MPRSSQDSSAGGSERISPRSARTATSSWLLCGGTTSLMSSAVERRKRLDLYKSSVSLYAESSSLVGGAPSGRLTPFLGIDDLPLAVPTSTRRARRASDVVRQDFFSLDQTT